MIKIGSNTKIKNSIIGCNQKEIEKLKKELKLAEENEEYWHNAFSDLEDEYIRLNKIIDIKTNRIQQLMKRLIKRQDKVDRLNNIINELENHLEKEIEEWQDVKDEWTKAQLQEDKIILNKLKELKENK